MSPSDPAAAMTDQPPETAGAKDPPAPAEKKPRANPISSSPGATTFAPVSHALSVTNALSSLKLYASRTVNEPSASRSAEKSGLSERNCP